MSLHVPLHADANTADPASRQARKSVELHVRELEDVIALKNGVRFRNFPSP